MYEYEVLLKDGERTFIWVAITTMLSAGIQKRQRKLKQSYFKSILIDLPLGGLFFSRLAVGVRRGQFFVSIGNLHNFPYAFLVNLTKEIFPKSLDFLCGLWYTYIIKREERNT